MVRQLAPIADDFFDTAGLVVKGEILVPNSPQQVWDALASDQMGNRFARATWQSPRPLSVGARRSVRLGGVLAVEELYYRWDDLSRATFRVTALSIPIVSGWAEDYQVEPVQGGGTRVRLTIAIDNRLLRRLHVPPRLQTALNNACDKAMRQLTTVLPASA